ncbi:MAG: prephenate dehydrogenase/arogenate dehydrogenase family protein, partial [Chloroflexota bacterium]
MAKLAIVGLGYLGTALGLAARASQLFETVTGYDAHPENAQAALAHGAVQALARGARDVVEGAAVTLLAVPDDVLPGLLRGLRQAFEPGAVVSSTSLWMAPATTAAEVLPESVHFLAGRPVLDHARLPAADASAQALRGAVYCLDATPRAEAAALDTMSALVRGFG